jgi:hypothetical protein
MLGACQTEDFPRSARCGHQELMGLRQRFRILDFERILNLLGVVSAAEFRQHFEALIQERIAKDILKREPEWTEAIAVGTEKSVGDIAGVTRGRQHLVIESQRDTWTLKEAGLTSRFRDRKQAAEVFIIVN